MSTQRVNKSNNENERKYVFLISSKIKNLLYIYGPGNDITSNASFHYPIFTIANNFLINGFIIIYSCLKKFVRIDREIVRNMRTDF